MLLTTFLIVCTTVSPCVESGERPLYSLDRAEEYFGEFIRKYDRKYVNKEENDKRFEIFKQNLNEINERNSDPLETAEFGVTKFADMTTEEVLPVNDRYKGDLDEGEIYKNVIKYDPRDNIGNEYPKTWDWRDLGFVSSVKDEKKCKASHLFAILGVFEITYGVTHNRILELSAQQFIDCGPTYGDRCEIFHSSWLTLAEVSLVRYVYGYGTQLSRDYPYVAKKEQCKFDPSKEQIQSWAMSVILPTPGQEENVVGWVASTSVAFTIDASSLQHYVGGILRNCTFKSFNHNVHAIGYGTENGVDYWLLKNSWGTDFGEQGYFRVPRGINACGFYNNLTMLVVF